MSIKFDCKNSHKRALCTQKCKTCYSRSFSSARIYKNIDGVQKKINPSKFWSSENETSPLHVTKSKNAKFKFDCSCGHQFEVSLDDCSRRGNWCPYHGSKKLCGNKECQFCFEKSFASAEKDWGRPSDFLIDQNPYLIFKKSHKKCSFECTDCGHIFQSPIYNVTSRDWPCSYCKGNVLCSNSKDPEKFKDACGVCFEKSFESHPKAKYWSGENIQNPGQVRKYTQKKFWFDCRKCGHDFEISLSNIMTNNSWCPYCSFPCKKLCGDEECEFCFDKSLASVVDEKNYKGQDPLHTILKGGRSKKYKFICDKGHKFSMRPNNISCCQWCPMCPKKTEAKMFLFLDEKFKGHTVTCQATFNWCKNKKTNRHFYYDFYLPHLSLIIEIDGPQHFKQISNWCSPEKIQKVDRYKEKRAIKNGLTIFRLLQTDVLFDKTFSWEKYFNKALLLLNDADAKIITISPKGITH